MQERRLKNLCMDKLHTVDKENLFGAIHCSPILSSGTSVLRENRTRNFQCDEKSACQDNRLSLPGTYTTAKLGLFLSTPVRQLPDRLPGSWEEIRKLDEEELWIERTQVVTKEDHLLYCELAKEIVNNIIENLPILNMDENNAECDNTVVAVGVMKDDLPNGLDASNPGEAVVCNENSVDVVCEERKEDMVTDMKDLVLNNGNEHSSDQHLEKSGLEEDNDFIFSCSDLDTTVKEVSANDDTVLENTIISSSDDKDVSDLDETIKEVSADAQTNSENTLPDNNLDPELVDDFNLQFDEGAFKPATVFGLELDFLESCGNSSGTDHISDLARQSLYVKFDPLVEARKPDQANQDSGGLVNINPADLLFQGPLATDDLLGMDTPPAKPVVSRRALLAQAQNTETATSVIAPVDLFALSPCHNINSTEKELEEGASKSESSIVVEPEEESSLVQPLQFSKNDLENAVEKAVEDEKENLLSQWNLQNSLHEAEMEKLLDERNKILEERNKITDENKVVKTLMMEYEQTMAQMIKDRENEQSQQEKSNSEIVQERDQLQRDLNNTEKSFAHLHEKFGKLKTAVESYRKNEDVLKKVVKDLQEDVKNAEAKYQVLKNHAEQKLQEANVEINRVQTTFKTELAGLQAAFKREKSKNTSLQQSLDQKVNENKELTAICDELISKVGPMT